MGSSKRTSGTTMSQKFGDPLDGDDVVVQQYDGTEVARIHDGANLPTATGTSTSLSAGTGLGHRKRILTLGSGNDDNSLALTAADSGCVIFVTPTNVLEIVLPLIGTETGFYCKIVLADKINKALTIVTAGQDGNDSFLMRAQSLADDGATAHVAAGDTLTFTNALEGSWINLTNVAGGAAEIWLAEVFSNDAVTATVA